MSNNYFELFDIEPNYLLEEEILEQKYTLLQSILHPDKFVGKSDQERQMALSRSMTINEAYNILKDPYQRAEYLLKLQDISIREDKNGIKPSQDLLIESMETREELMEVNTKEDAKAMQVSNDNAKQEAIFAIGELLEVKNWQEAAQATMRLRYLDKLDEEIRRKIETL